MRILFPATLLFFCQLFFSACSSSEASTPAPDPDTDAFNAYLKQNFADSIPASHHLYILISKKDSRENISTILTRISRILKTKKPENYSMIVSVNMPVADSLISGKNPHTDWNGAIDNLKLNLSGVTLVRTTDQKVSEMLPLFPEIFETERQFLERQ